MIEATSINVDTSYVPMDVGQIQASLYNDS